VSDANPFPSGWTPFGTRRLAVVGASNDPDSVGARFVRPLRRHGFTGDVVVVHPREDEVLGYQAYPRLAGVVEIDYAIVSVGRSRIVEAVGDAARAGAKVVHVFTGGFAETGTPHGAALQAEIVAAAQRNGARILGPNCMGIHRPAAGWSFRDDLPVIDGSLGIASQSGGIAIAAIRTLAARRLGTSAVVSFGNSSDIGAADALRWLVADSHTESIALYVESAGTPELAEVLVEAARHKPVTLWASGITPVAQRAAVFHTGAVGGPVRAWPALPGVRVADDLGTFVGLPPTPGPDTDSGLAASVATVSISGGVSVVLAEAFERWGAELPPLSPDTQATLRRLGGDLAGNVENPVDLGGSYLSRGRLGPVLTAVASDLAVEQVVFHLALDYVDEVERRHPGYVRAWLQSLVAALTGLPARPAVLLWPPGVSGSEGLARQVLGAAGFPLFTELSQLRTWLATSRTAASTFGGGRRG
jgi:acyl-CoA synthetase (NDP forming)